MDKNLKKLQQLEYCNRYKDSSVPDYARFIKKYSDKTANSLTKCIIDWITLNGGHAERVNTMGRPIDQTKIVANVLGQQQKIGSMKWGFGSGKRGSADIHSIIKGKSVMIEVKIGRDKQSEHQKIYQSQVERAGAIYYIARNFSDFVEFYNTLI